MKKILLKWLFILLPLTISMGPCEFGSSCKAPTSPELPEPIEPTYYTIQLKYTRPAGSITRPDQLYKQVAVLIQGAPPLSFSSGFTSEQRIDDYNYTWSEGKLIPDNETSTIYSMWGLDAARWNGSDDTAVVGDIFFIRVKETGFEKQLTNVVQNNHPNNPYPGPNARMVQWRLKKDGTVVEK